MVAGRRADIAIECPKGSARIPQSGAVQPLEIAPEMVQFLKVRESLLYKRESQEQGVEAGGRAQKQRGWIAPPSGAANRLLRGTLRPPSPAPPRANPPSLIASARVCR